MTDIDTATTDEEVAAPVAAGTWAGLFGPLALVSLVLSIIAIIVAVNAGGTTIVQSGTASGGGAQTLDATLSEFAFSFSDSTIAADTDVAVSLTNVGVVDHAFAVLREGVNPADEASISDSMVVADLGTIGGSESGSGSLNLPPAEYLVVCLVPGHFDAGMSASLTVAAS